MIHITETAAKAMVTTCKSADTEVAGMRLSLLKQGCTGYAYSFDFIDSVNEDDHLFQSFELIEDGYVLAVADEILPKLDGMTIDYSTKNFITTYEFINPNVDNSCGCGSSVNFK
jgi:iron-sulfur cluster assembly protein